MDPELDTIKIDRCVEGVFMRSADLKDRRYDSPAKPSRLSTSTSYTNAETERLRVRAMFQDRPSTSLGSRISRGFAAVGVVYDFTSILPGLAEESAVLPAAVYAELMAGVLLAQTPTRAAARRAKIEALTLRLPVVDFGQIPLEVPEQVGRGASEHQEAPPDLGLVHEHAQGRRNIERL